MDEVTEASYIRHATHAAVGSNVRQQQRLDIISMEKIQHAAAQYVTISVHSHLSRNEASLAAWWEINCDEKCDRKACPCVHEELR